MGLERILPVEMSVNEPITVEKEQRSETPTSVGESVPVVMEIDEPHEENEEKSPQASLQIEIAVEELPGAPEEAFSPVMEVKEEEPSKEEKEVKEKKSIWSWEEFGVCDGFFTWIQERLNSVPKHSGYDIAGVERAISYLEKLLNEISRAMRMDLEGILDAEKIEKTRTQIEDGIDRLKDRIVQLKQKGKNKKKAEEIISFTKEGQKAFPMSGMVICVPVLIARIARVCINGTISAGHDLEYLFEKQAKKYKLTERERVEVMQVMTDLGYPLRQDRGLLPDEDVDETSSDNFDWSANYPG